MTKTQAMLEAANMRGCLLRALALTEGAEQRNAAAQAVISRRALRRNGWRVLPWGFLDRVEARS